MEAHLAEMAPSVVKYSTVSIFLEHPVSSHWNVYVGLVGNMSVDLAVRTGITKSSQSVAIYFIDEEMANSCLKK